METKEIKQIPVRLLQTNWKVIRMMCLDREITFQKLVKDLLAKEVAAYEKQKEEEVRGGQEIR